MFFIGCEVAFRMYPYPADRCEMIAVPARVHNNRLGPLLKKVGANGMSNYNGIKYTVVFDAIILQQTHSRNNYMITVSGEGYGILVRKVGG